MANISPILSLIRDFSVQGARTSQNFDRYVSDGLVVDPGDPEDPVYVVFGLFLELFGQLWAAISRLTFDLQRHDGPLWKPQFRVFQRAQEAYRY